MKIRSILFALSAMAIAMPAVAQEAAQRAPIQNDDQRLVPHVAVPGETSKFGPSLMEEQEYIWFTRHFRDLGPDETTGDNTDRNRVSMVIPRVYPSAGLELRGAGQLFAPGMFYTMFNALPNDTTGLLRTTEDEVLNDAAYYEQFKDAKDFTISRLLVYVYKNPNGATPLAGMKLTIFSNPTGTTDRSLLNSSTYKTNGVRFRRASLPIKFEADITPEGLDSTLGDGTINPTDFIFDPPLTFTAGQFAMPIILNDEADPVDQLVENDPSDYQIMPMFLDRRQGQTGAANGFGGASNAWKSLGLVMMRTAGSFDPETDTIYNLSRTFTFGTGASQTPGTGEAFMTFLGTVDIQAGVKYHYGTEASSQGLGSPTPNPVVADARLPFSLTAVSNVKIDLFDVNGTHVRTLVDARYIPGNYSAALEVGDLTAGTYVARMVAGENVYSMKINVVR